MCKFIGIECVAGNAIASLLDNDGKREVSFETIIRYGLSVAEVYTSNTAENATLIFDRYAVDSFSMNCSDIFDIKLVGDVKMLCLKDCVKDADELRERFLYPLSYELISAMVSDKCLNALGVT